MKTAAAGRARWLAFSAHVLAVLAGGCASPYAHLRSEREIPRFADLVREEESLAPAGTLLVPTHRKGEPDVRLAVRRVGNPRADGPVLVFVHGAFSDATAWRYLCGALGRDHTLLLIDLPGCGRSDKPAPGALARDGYGPTALADRVYQAVAESLASEPPERRVVLVGHSLGSMIAVRMLSEPHLRQRYAPVRGRVAGAVLFTPLDVAIERPIPSLEYVAHMGWLDVAAAKLSGRLREGMAQAVAAAYDDPSVAPREEADRGVRIISRPAERRAMQAMILQATPRRPGTDPVRPDWPAVDRLVAQYANVDVPVRIVCGAHDETMPAATGYKLAAQIPGATLRVLPNCMHSPHLEYPSTCAGIIRDFLKKLRQ